MKTTAIALLAVEPRTRLLTGVLSMALCVSLLTIPAQAQVLLTGNQLDQLVAQIALYPDPLLAQVLAASTYSDQIPDAAQWADQHSHLTGDKLAAAISEDYLSWDPSIRALLPFPSVLDMMSSNIFWTRQLGDAALGQRADVMDAVQRMRQTAMNNGYLADCPQYRVAVSDPGWIEILPVDPGFYFVPIYDPLLIFRGPRAGLG
jgi:hypothetical protein